MSTLWVFGYGSLVWNPGFEYAESKCGHIDDYSRRFWQGSDVHRGTSQKLGRVVTLIQETSAKTHGRAFRLKDEATALAYLGKRESLIGGYTTVITQFYPKDPKENPIPVLVYIALPNNSLFLGSAPLPEVANQIVESKGQCGFNVEYLAKLAAFMRLNFPGVWDDHLFTLEILVRSKLKEDKATLLNFFDEAVLLECQTSSVKVDESEKNDMHQHQTLLSSSPSYADTVPGRKLRCLDI